MSKFIVVNDFKDTKVQVPIAEGNEHIIFWEMIFFQKESAFKVSDILGTT